MVPALPRGHRCHGERALLAALRHGDRPVTGNTCIDHFPPFNVGIASGLKMTGSKTVISLGCKQIIC